MLICELPDPHQELYLQYSNNLNTFTLFPKLVFELRLKIWRATFPAPRHIQICQENPSHLGLSFLNSATYIRSPLLITTIDFGEIKPLKNYLPIALSVNKESREEALRHYILIPRPPSKHQKSSRGPVVRMPLCFGLKVDTASYFLPAFNMQYEYLESMNKRAPKLFPSIKKLELLCCVGTTSSDYKLVPSQPADLLRHISCCGAGAVYCEDLPASN